MSFLLYHHCNHSIHVTDNLTVRSLSAVLLQKMLGGNRSSMPNRVKPKIIIKLKNRCKPSSCVETKSHKKKLHKTGPACMLLHCNRQLTNSFIIE